MRMPQRVPADVVRPADTPVATRLRDVRQRVLSRASLERLVTDLRLYEALRRQMSMEGVVEHMRRDIDVRVTAPTEPGDGALLQISFVYHDPKVSQKVADRLSVLVIDEMLQERVVLAEATHDFLASQVDDTRDRLLTNARAIATARTARKDDEARVLGLESEVLEGTYKTLLAKQAEARVRTALERRQIGEQFWVIDRARVPEHPLGPTRAGATAVGGIVGAVIGLLWMALYFRSSASRTALASSGRS
jgi:uncharacterized protein involved in exopolysaccharide biosynthesis